MRGCRACSASVRSPLTIPPGQVTQAELRRHRQRRQRARPVVERPLRRRPGHDLEPPGRRVDRDQHRVRSRAPEAACRASPPARGVALEDPDVDRVGKPARLAGQPDRACDVVALPRRERLTSGHWCPPSGSPEPAGRPGAGAPGDPPGPRTRPAWPTRTAPAGSAARWTMDGIEASSQMSADDGQRDADVDQRGPPERQRRGLHLAVVGPSRPRRSRTPRASTWRQRP